MKRETTEERERRRDAAYERGWVDSLSAYAAHSVQPNEDLWDYGKGWEACAKYRWKDVANQGCAPDENYRTPRT